jgi:starch-binding outer membrane protein, SusD/RagB family
MKYKKYLSYVGKRFSLLAGLIIIIVSACNQSDYLKENPLDFLAPSNAFTAPSTILQGLSAMYKDVRDNLGFSFSGDDDPSLYGLGTDIGYDGEEPGGLRFLTNYVTSLTSTHAQVAKFWNNSYSLIQKCCVIIDAVNATDDKIWSSVAEKNANLAEAMFFRAYAYRILVTLWGDVPLVAGVINFPKTDFVRAPKTEVYKQIETDLIFAAANLPKKGAEKAMGRVTQGAAWHYLSEIYLAQAKYQLAIDAATHVINDYGYALMTNRFGTHLSKDIWGAGDPFFDLFQKGNPNLANNSEGIWVIQYKANVTGGGSYGGTYQWGPSYFRIPSTPDGVKAFRGVMYNGVYTGYIDSLSRPVARVRPTNYVVWNVWRSDWNNDLRNAKQNIKRAIFYDAPGSIYDRQKIDFSKYPPGRDPIKDTCQYIFPYWTKLGTPLEYETDPARCGGGQSHADKYAIRLAETYLLRAEAYLGLNQKDLAAADINVIRNRAHATPVIASQVTIDYILDERVRELYSEEQRLITLMRLGKLIERTRKYNDNPINPGCNIKDYNNVWPIPQTQIDLNVNVKMEQNPGY